MKKNCFARMHPSLKTASVPDAPASVVAAPEDSSNPDSQSSETVVSERPVSYTHLTLPTT